MASLGYFRPTSICQVDDIPVREHARCKGCLILAGMGHYDAGLERGLCRMCRARPTLFEKKPPTQFQTEQRRREDEVYHLRYVERWPVKRIATEMLTYRRNVHYLLDRARNRKNREAAGA